MREHALKIWPELFEAVLGETKRHEVRRNDRDYQVGDTLLLREWKPDEADLRAGEWQTKRGGFTGRAARVKVTHITRGGSWGLPLDVCVMSIEGIEVLCD